MSFDNQDLKRFTARFRFDRGKDGYIGIEREHFLMSPRGILSPSSEEFLKLMNDPQHWTYELSSCQVEDHTHPERDLSAIKLNLLANDNGGALCAKKLGLQLVNREVGDKNMPLDIYPDPRYLSIVSAISQERLIAACRVTGTHVHIGARNMCRAIEVYNVLVPHLVGLCDLGDHSAGERLRLYKMMAINWQPIVYRSIEHFFEVSREQNFTDNPRNCWHLIRISIHGTVELRMFGVTDQVDEITDWISHIRFILKGGD